MPLILQYSTGFFDWFMNYSISSTTTISLLFQTMSKEKTNLKLVIGGLICIKPRVKTSGQFLDGKLKSSWTAILWPDSANASRVSMSSRLFQDDSSRLSMFSGWCLRTWKFEKYILFFHFRKNGFKKIVLKNLPPWQRRGDGDHQN